MQYATPFQRITAYPGAYGNAPTAPASLCHRRRWHHVGSSTPLTALKHPAHCADTVLSHPCPTASRDARHNRLRCQYVIGSGWAPHT